MYDIILKLLYSVNKLFVIIAGVYIVFWPPFSWVGTVSSAIMAAAGAVSIYAIWTHKYALEFISLWFVCAGVASYAGFMWQSIGDGESTLARAAIASMALVMLIARGVTLWRLVSDLDKFEGQLNNGD